MVSIGILSALALAQSIAPVAQAPEAAPQVAAPQVAAPAATAVRLPALTPLRLRVEGEISSSTHVAGDKIVIVLADPIRVTDALVIPAGTRGVGEVIHSAKKGMGGKAGELLVAARTLDLAPGVSVPLRSFRLAPASGKNQEGLAAGLMIAGGAVGGIAALVVTGGSARIADGSEAIAKTASDVDLPHAALVPLAGSTAPIAADSVSSPTTKIDQ
jgi:hypothetical protein